MTLAPAHRSTRHWPDWVGLVARLVPGIVFVWAGLTKVLNVPYFIDNIDAYRLIPRSLSPLLGYTLPFVEIVAGILLILGLFTRWAAAITLLMLLGFIGGIAWVWSQGINIDCGCFGTGGEVAQGETQYPLKIAENLGMGLLCLWLVVRPRSVFSLDHTLFDAPVALPQIDGLDDEPQTKE